MGTTETGASSPAKPNEDQKTHLYLAPTEREARLYYAAFPSSPRLLGRTSSVAQPWPYNSDDETARFGYQSHGIEHAFMRFTVVGPVGNHKIQDTWATGTGPNVIQVLKQLNLQWISIDILRMCPPTPAGARLPNKARPVIVWIGISRRAYDNGEAAWPRIANALERVRAVLDQDSLFDVECEIRVSDVFRTADHGAGGATEANDEATPMLTLTKPLRGDDALDIDLWEIDAGMELSTNIGRTIAPDHAPQSKGTLGMYLAPEVAATNNEPGQDSNAPFSADTVWFLTCHHVVYPGKFNHLRKKEGEDKSGEDEENDNKDPTATNMPLRPGRIISPTPHALKAALRFKEYNMSKILAQPESTRRRQLKILSDVREFAESPDEWVIGTVQHAPPIGINETPCYTRDWALVTVNRDLFPANFSFENLARVQKPNVSTTDHLIQDLLGSDDFRLPEDGLVRLQTDGVIPLREMRGAPILNNPHIVLKDGDWKPVVMKTGRSTGTTIGVPLDMASYARYDPSLPLDSASVEWAVVHASATVKREEQDRGKILPFSEGGDSGSAIFDLTGRVGGLLTGGSGQEGFKSTTDVTYATPMEHLLRDVEQEIGVRVRIL